MEYTEYESNTKSVLEYFLIFAKQRLTVFSVSHPDVQKNELPHCENPYAFGISDIFI